MKSSSIPQPKGAMAIGLAVVLVLFASFFRVFRVEALPELPNFSPVMAIALCGALVLPGWLALVVPLAALIPSDLLLNAHYGAPLLGPETLLIYACYGLAVASGVIIRERGIPSVLGATLANSLIFYLVTNTAAWLANPAYAQSAAGWLQALTIGIPGFPPTWMFFLRSLAGDLLFTGGFLAALHLACRPSSTLQTARA